MDASTICLYAEFTYAEVMYAEFTYAEFTYAEFMTRAPFYTHFVKVFAIYLFQNIQSRAWFAIPVLDHTDFCPGNISERQKTYQQQK